jgi:serine/threonine protein kinase
MDGDDQSSTSYLVDDRYEILERLGEGAFGEVWKAQDIKFRSRVVALKLLRSELLNDHEALVRFGNEAEALAILQHPNVVVILDKGRWKNRHFMVMEFIEGEQLSTWLKRFLSSGELPPLELVRDVFDQICAGVAAAHRLEIPGPIVHRDLKPANIMLRQGSSNEILVKVLDFGVARLGIRQLTMTGGLMGTPVYMAPEQGMGQVSEICPATDVFALAVILVTMLTGKVMPTNERPWWIWALSGESNSKFFIDTLQRDVPNAVWDLIKRSLLASPKDRPEDADQLRSEIRTAWMTPNASTNLLIPKTIPVRQDFEMNPVEIQNKDYDIDLKNQNPTGTLNLNNLPGFDEQWSESDEATKPFLAKDLLIVARNGSLPVATKEIAESIDPQQTTNPLNYETEDKSIQSTLQENGRKRLIIYYLSIFLAITIVFLIGVILRVVWSGDLGNNSNIPFVDPEVVKLIGREETKRPNASTTPVAKTYNVQEKQVEGSRGNRDKINKVKIAQDNVKQKLILVAPVSLSQEEVSSVLSSINSNVRSCFSIYTSKPNYLLVQVEINAKGRARYFNGWTLYRNNVKGRPVSTSLHCVQREIGHLIFPQTNTGQQIFYYRYKISTGSGTRWSTDW